MREVQTSLRCTKPVYRADQSGSPYHGQGCYLATWHVVSDLYPLKACISRLAPAGGMDGWVSKREGAGGAAPLGVSIGLEEEREQRGTTATRVAVPPELPNEL